MDNTTWAFGPDGPQWPVDGSGQKEKAVRLMNSFDSAADSDMTISLLAAYGIPCFKYYDLDGGAAVSPLWQSASIVCGSSGCADMSTTPFSVMTPSVGRPSL